MESDNPTQPESTSETAPQTTSPFKQYKKYIIGFSILIDIIIFSVIWFYFSGQSNQEQKPKPNVTPSVSVPSQSQSQPQSIDTLDYFLSDHPEQGLTGTHPLSQTIDGNSVYYVKWSATSYERLFWDDTYIYLREDHSEAPNQPYIFTPGIWMKRQMRVGESLIFTSGENSIQFFTSTCDPVGTNSGPYNYVMTLENHFPDYNAGGDLGVQDVIVLTYDYRPAGAINYEKFYYSKEWGWIKWENVDAAGNVVQTSEFNRFHKVISPKKSVSCLK